MLGITKCKISAHDYKIDSIDRPLYQSIEHTFYKITMWVPPGRAIHELPLPGGTR
jgi:hypothetical protein